MMKKKVKLFFLFYLLVIFLVVLAGCQASPAEEAEGEKELAVYKVGVVLDLTGIRASIGITNRRGMEIAADEINTAGGVNGRQLELVFYDAESDPSETVKAVSRIIEVDKAVAVLGSNAVDGTMASLQTATDAKIPMISSAPAVVTGADTPEWMFTVVPDQVIASIPILINILLERGSTNIACMYIDTTYGELGQRALHSVCEKLGINPVALEQYATDTIDYTPHISRINASGADGLIITGNLKDTVQAIKTAKDMGVEYPIVSDYAIVGPEFIDLGKNYVEGIVSTSLKTLVAPDLPDDDIHKGVTMSLYESYLDQYGDFSLYVAHGWDQVHLLKQALEECDSGLDPTNDQDLMELRKQLRDNIEGIEGFVGQNGVFHFSPDNHIGLGEGSYIPVVVKDGKWRLYE